MTVKLENNQKNIVAHQYFFQVQADNVTGAILLKPDLSQAHLSYQNDFVLSYSFIQVTVFELLNFNKMINQSLLIRRVLQQLLGFSQASDKLNILNESSFPYFLQHTRHKVCFSHSLNKMTILFVPERLAENIGVDIEQKVISLAVAKRYFSSVEQQAISGLSGVAQARLIQRLWCLKESYIKAIGSQLFSELSTCMVTLFGYEILDLQRHNQTYNDWFVYFNDEQQFALVVK